MGLFTKANKKRVKELTTCVTFKDKSTKEFISIEESDKLIDYFDSKLLQWFSSDKTNETYCYKYYNGAIRLVKSEILSIEVFEQLITVD